MLTKVQHAFLTRFILDLPDDLNVVGAEASGLSAADLTAASMAWSKARDAALYDLTKLISRLLIEDDPELAEVAVLVGQLAERLPNDLGAQLDAVAKRLPAITDVALPNGLANMSDYLRQNDAALARCEKNPFGVDVDIRQRLATALEQIERTLTAVHKP